MARLSDLPHVLRAVGPFRFIRRVGNEVIDDNIFTWAAALAYSWIFAIFPFLIFLLALLPYMPHQYKDPTRDEIKRMIAQAIPSTKGEALQQAVDHVFTAEAGGLLSFGILLALYAASGGMNATMAALDRCYDIEIGRAFVLQRLAAAGLTLLVAAMIILVLCLVPVGTQVIGYLKIEGATAFLINLARYGIALMLCLTILSLIYHFGPSVRSHWTWISPGSLFVVISWAILAFAFRYYIDNFAAASYAKTYGVVGSIVLLLLVLYVDAIVLLVGAEINSEIDFAVLGVTSNANRGNQSAARANLSVREQKMLSDLVRRRPAASALADVDRLAASTSADAARPPTDPAAAGPVYPYSEADSDPKSS